MKVRMLGRASRSLLIPVSHRLLVLAAAALLACLALSGGARVPVASATGFMVNDPGDTNTAAAQGDCNSNLPGCTLRAALTVAASSGDTITFDSALSGMTITLAGTELLINKSLTITGPAGGITVSGNLSSRVFEVAPSVAVILNDMTVTNGNPSSFAALGGGILNNGSLIVNSSTVRDNVSIDGGGIGNSGGTLTIINSSVTDNTSNGVGGGIANNGTMFLTDSTVSNNANTNVGGGGIYNSGTLTVTDSTISDNMAVTGGGIDNYLNATATLNRTTVSGNSAAGASFGPGTGGGIRNDGAMTLTNSTVSTNSATQGAFVPAAPNAAGGGIGQFSGTLTLNNSTISNNSAAESGGLGHSCSINCGMVVVKNTIIANNSVGNCGGGGGGPTNHGVNLYDDSTCGGASVNVHIVAPGAAGLDGLSLNPPGTTRTHALIVGSPAIDTVTDCTKDDGTTFIATDQRGVLRPQNVSCDIGAYEYVSTGTITICKHTDPPNGAGFSFLWSAPNIRARPFPLDDGQCATESGLLPADGPYSVSELSPLPLGWALTDIVCTGGANVSIGSNSVFDQGDTGVGIDLGSGENVTCTFTNGTATVCNADTPGFTVIQNISTGQNGGPVTLDQSWSRGPTLYGPVYSTAPATVPLWTTAPSGSRWINYYAPPSLGVVYAPPGQYPYQTSFYVNTTLYYGLELEFQWAADNNASIDLNGSNIATGSASFSALSNAVLATPTSSPALLANQTNTLTAYVDNTSTGYSPTGLLVRGTLTGCLKQPVGPTKHACITIIKDAVPNDPQDFNFTWNGPPFILDDDPASATPNSITNCDLSGGGTYTITETSIPIPWNLSNISCSQSPSPWATIFIGPATPASFNSGDNSVKITLPSTLPSGASIVCVFTNEKLPQGCITIVKDRQPNSPEDFNFTWNGGVTPFVLDDDHSSTTPNSITNCDLIPGFAYYVKELGPVLPSQTTLVHIACNVSPAGYATVHFLPSGYPSYHNGDNTVAVNILTNTGNVTCTFANSPSYPSGPSGLLVDSNCDGRMNAIDAINGLRYVAGLKINQEAGCPPVGSTVVVVADTLGTLGDWNCDGKVDSTDTLLALKDVVQLPIDLPLECG